MTDPKHAPIWTLRVLPPHATRELWKAFKAKAHANGWTPTVAVGRLLRRYLDRGFEDGGPETQTPDRREKGADD